MVGKVYRRGKAKAWYVSYRFDGKDVRLSVATALNMPVATVTKEEAEEVLTAKIAELHLGTHLGPEHRRVTVAELLDRYVQDLELRGGRWKTAQRAARAPREAFGHLWASRLMTPMLKTYMKQRLDAGVAPATIMQDTWVLRGAFNLAKREGGLTAVPFFPSLPVHNTRRGFVEPEQFEAILARIGGQLYRDVALFSYIAARRANEVLRIPWAWVDRESREIRWPKTKNGDQLTLPLDGELWEIIERRWKDRPVGRWISPWVFHVQQRNALSYGTYGVRFRQACIGAGYPGILPHDLRRSGIRNMVRAGVDKTVAMSISGHRSESVFRRYNITSTADQTQAFQRVAAYRQSRSLGHPLSLSEATRPDGHEDGRVVAMHQTK